MTTTTAVRERPITFSALMVKAILDGKKVQTRRVIEPQFGRAWGCGVPSKLGFECAKPGQRWKDAFGVDTDIKAPDGRWTYVFCPHGKIGDRLWVRESWQGWLAGDFPVIEYPAGGSDPHGCNPPRPGFNADHPCWSDWKVRPSRYMPRWASRITLEITEIKVERVAGISVADCVAEGLELNDIPIKPRYELLWDSINGKREGCSWRESPWVWAISFRRIEPA